MASPPWGEESENVLTEDTRRALEESHPTGQGRVSASRWAGEGRGGDMTLSTGTEKGVKTAHNARFSWAGRGSFIRTTEDCCFLPATDRASRAFLAPMESSVPSLTSSMSRARCWPCKPPVTEAFPREGDCGVAPGQEGLPPAPTASMKAPFHWLFSKTSTQNPVGKAFTSLRPLGAVCTHSSTGLSAMESFLFLGECVHTVKSESSK